MGRWDAVSMPENPIGSRGTQKTTSTVESVCPIPFISSMGMGNQETGSIFRMNIKMTWWELICVGNSYCLSSAGSSKCKTAEKRTAAKRQGKFSAAQPWQEGTRKNPLGQHLKVNPLQPDSDCSNLRAFAQKTPGSNTRQIQQYRDAKQKENKFSRA